MNMKTIFGACLLALACCTPPKPASVTTTNASFPEKLRSETIALVEQKDSDTQAYCSGVWVSPTAILTANHCMQGDDIGTPKSYVVDTDVYPDGSKFEAPKIKVRPATIIALDEHHDLALLRAPEAPPHPSARVQESVVVGEPTAVMGHSLGLWWSYSEGLVSAVRGMSFEDAELAILWVQTTAPTSPGNSGGGMFNGTGELIGICHGYYPEGENLNLFVHPSYIHAFLEGKAL